MSRNNLPEVVMADLSSAGLALGCTCTALIDAVL